MRRMISIAAVMVLGTAAASAAPVRAPLLPAPLLPLSEADTTTGEYGCQSAFDQGDATYIFVINDRFILRTAPGAAGLTTCHPGSDTLAAFGDCPTNVTCAGRRLSIRTLGPVRVAHPNPEADSSQSHAILTMSDGTHTRQVRGVWGTAC